MHVTNAAATAAPPGYLNLALRIGRDHAERLCDALSALGALAVSIDDALAGSGGEQAVFGEPGMAEPALWEQCRVVGLFDAGRAPAELAESAAALAGLEAAPPWNAESLGEQDWVSLTQSQFQPIRISSRLWIVPTWHPI